MVPNVLFFIRLYFTWFNKTITIFTRNALHFIHIGETEEVWYYGPASGILIYLVRIESVKDLCRTSRVCVLNALIFEIGPTTRAACVIISIRTRAAMVVYTVYTYIMYNIIRTPVIRPMQQTPWNTLCATSVYNASAAPLSQRRTDNILQTRSFETRVQWNGHKSFLTNTQYKADRFII